MSILTSIEQLHPKHLSALTAPLTRLIKARLWLQILVAMALGIGAGLLLNAEAGLVEPRTGRAIAEWLALPGYLFLAFIQMIVIPLILSSIIRGIAAAADIQQLKSTGIWVGVFFLVTTMLAVSMGIGIGLLTKPGAYIDSTAIVHPASGRNQAASAESVAETAAQAVEERTPVTIADVPEHLTSYLPTNPVSSIVEGEMLQIVIFAIPSAVS